MVRLYGRARRLTAQNGGFRPGAVVNSSESFAAALGKAVAFAGPDNYCPVLVGALAGARPAQGGAAMPRCHSMSLLVIDSHS
jgi:hypothetical protein